MADNSGPVFPFLERGPEGVFYEDSYRLEGGLTKREWFAGMVIQGLIAEPKNSDFKNFKDIPSALAKAAYLVADAMLTEGEK